jgi:hypothetical protein
MRARKRIAVERAAHTRALARRRFMAATVAVTAVLAVVDALVAVKLNSAGAAAAETLAPPSVVSRVTTVPASVLARVPGGQAATPLQTVKASGQALRINAKPAIVFVSEESCPFCAAQRWPLVVALSHFGSWSHLGTTRSSATDVSPAPPRSHSAPRSTTARNSRCAPPN